MAVRRKHATYGVDDRGRRCYAADRKPQPRCRRRLVEPPLNFADQSFNLVDPQLVQLVEPRLVLPGGTAQRRVGRHADVVEVSNDLLPAVDQIRKEETVFVRPPAGRSRLPDVQRVRVPVQPEHSLACEREVGVVERLAVTKADERVKHGTQRLLSAYVADGSYQVAVGLQQTGQSSVGGRHVGGNSGKRQNGRVSPVPRCTDTSVQPADNDVYYVRVKLYLHAQTQ